MELLIVMILLALSDKDPDLKRRLSSVLDFYRENREMLMALSGAANAASSASASASPASNPSDSKTPPAASNPSDSQKPDGADSKKNSPPKEGELKILEEFLKRL